MQNIGNIGEFRYVNINKDIEKTLQSFITYQCRPSGTYEKSRVHKKNGHMEMFAKFYQTYESRPLETLERLDLYISAQILENIGEFRSVHINADIEEVICRDLIAH